MIISVPDIAAGCRLTVCKLFFMLFTQDCSKVLDIISLIITSYNVNNIKLSRNLTVEYKCCLKTYYKNLKES
jgi:hypothetical protein